MDGIQWLIWSLFAIGTVAVLVSLHCLCLWLEDRGWLYYLHKKPSSSTMSSWVVMQQFIEPGVKHVVEVKQENRIENEEASKERILPMLVETLRSYPFNTLAVEGAALDSAIGPVQEEIPRAIGVIPPDPCR
jgi:hypothetical protein